VGLVAGLVNVRWLFVRQGSLLALGGVLIGGLAAAALTRYIQTLLFDVERFDAVAFAGTAVIMLIVALLASYIPARRASRVDPVIALRGEEPPRRTVWVRLIS